MSGEENRQRPGAIAMGWWSTHIAPRDDAAARGLSARLRRATGSLPVLCESTVQELGHSLRLGPNKADILVRLVCLLAEIREHGGSKLPRLLGGDEPVKTPVMSHARFEKLVCAKGDELTSLMRHAILMSERKCNVASLAEDLIYWNEKTRKRWAFDYFDPKKSHENMTENGLGGADE